MKERIICLLGGLLIFLLACSGTSFAYNVTGTIQNSTGLTGNTVYVMLIDSSSTNSTGIGTTLTNVQTGSTSFTIRGVPQGQYKVAAFMDTQNTGSLHINDPFAMNGAYTAGPSDVDAGTLTLSSVSSPTAPSALKGINVVTSDNGVLVVWNGPKGQAGGSGPDAELANSYVIYWGTAANPGDTGAAIGSKTVPATGSDYHVFISSLTTNSNLYFAVKAVNTAGNAYLSTSQSYTIAAPTGGATVTGRVYSTGIAKSSSTPLYIALQGSQGGFYIGEVANPGDTQSWSITGVQPDTYSVYVILDMNNDGFSRNYGYITDSGVGGEAGVAPFFTVSSGASSATAPDITLKEQNSIAAVTTQNYENSNYQLQFRVSSETKRPVSAVVNSGANISGPIDLGINGSARFGNNSAGISLSTKPAVGDTYSVSVLYSDGSSETLSPKVTGVVDTLPSLAYPQGNTPPIFTGSSLFAWQTPSTLPAGYYDYSLWLSSASGQVWSPQDQGNNMPSTQINVPFNTDGSASQASLTSGDYFWTININDAFGNMGMVSSSFTPQAGGPYIDNFTPSGGASGTSVTINGSGFTGASAVSFGGIAAASFTVNSDTKITATVPTDAPVGLVTVTVAGITGGSSTAFQATTTYTGNVKNSSNAAVSGATVSLVNDPSVTATTDGSGNYTITVPSGVPVSFKISATTYKDLITSFQLYTKPVTSTTSHTLVNDSDLSSLGFSVSGKGLISSRVKDWDSGANMSGATVTASSFLHPDTPYTVYYSNPAGSGLPVSTGSTYTDGRFYVPNVDEGDIVTVTASLNGYASQTRTYVTHIGTVSETKVQVTPLPTVTATPSGGSISQATTVSLAVSNAVGGDTYVIYYTTDNSDPTTSGSRQTYTTPFNLNTGSVTLKFYAVNTTHNVSGNISSASYSVYTTPGAPTGVSAVAGNAQATVSFSPPSNNGGSTITSYTVTSSPGGKTASGSASPITVTGLSNGTAYTFTVTATNAAGTGPSSSPSNSVTPAAPSYTLGVTVNGTGSGQVTSSPTGIDCPAGNCSASFNPGTTVTLSQSASNGSQFTGWSGGFCSGTGACSGALNADQSVTATFNVDPYIQFKTNPGTYYGLLQQAYNAAVDGAIIQARAVTLDTDNLTMGNGTNVTIEGGYDAAFGNQTGDTTLQGTLTVSSGSLVADHLTIK